MKVSNVSLGASEQDIKEFFSFSGEIEHVDIQRLVLLLLWIIGSLFIIVPITGPDTSYIIGLVYTFEPLPFEMAADYNFFFFFLLLSISLLESHLHILFKQLSYNLLTLQTHTKR